ncbi:MAG: MATE family efflux transporter [Planctomycetaceae bacterium]
MSQEVQLQPLQPGTFRELVHVALPLVISAGSHSLMSVADRVMLSGYTPSAGFAEAAGHSASTTLDMIAAVTPASMLHWTAVCVPLGTILYANTFISQFDGARQPRQLATAFWQAVWLAFVCGILLTGLIPFSYGIFRFVGHTDAVAVQETAYFNTLCRGSVLLLMSMALSCFFSGRRQTRVVMTINLVSVAINVALDYLLVFGRIGLPELGIAGAAWATVLARGCDVLLYSFLIHRTRSSHGLPLKETWRPDRTLLKQYLRYGVPSGFHSLADNAAFLTFLFIVGSLNRDAMAATNLAFSVNSLVFVPLLGFGTAVQTLVGHHLGARLQSAAVRTVWTAVALAIVWTGSAAVLLLWLPDLALKPFLLLTDGSSSASGIGSVLPLAETLLRFVALYSVFDALAVVVASALRGAGDTLFPMIVTMVSGWLVMTIPAWLIVRSGDATIQKLWLTCSAHIILMGVTMLARFMSGRWKQLKLT